MLIPSPQSVTPFTKQQEWAGEEGTLCKVTPSTIRECGSLREAWRHQGPEIETTLSHMEISLFPMRSKQNKLVVICRRIDLSPPSTEAGADLGITTLCEEGGGQMEVGELPCLGSLA